MSAIRYRRPCYSLGAWLFGLLLLSAADDVRTLTVAEFTARNRWGRLRYRLYRHPAIMFGLGLDAFLLIYLPIVLLAASARVWLFYVQHQFERTYWARSERRSLNDAAIHGSSRLTLWDERRRRLVSFAEAYR